MDSLLHPIHSHEHQFLLDLMEAFRFSKTVSNEQVSRLLMQNHLTESELLPWLGERNLIYQDKTGVRLTDAIAPFIPPLSELEREYLADILCSEEAKLFFPGEIPSVPGDRSRLSYIRRQNASGRNDRPIQYDSAIFRTILTGICQRRRLLHTWRTRDSEMVRTSELIPFRLEYQGYDGRWWVIFYDDAEDRLVKSQLQNILSASLGNVHAVSDETIQSSILKHRVPEPLKLHIRDEKNALERCFITFDDVLELDGERLEDGSYSLTLSYLDFDEKEIVKKLMYLGECVTVESPERVRSALIEKIRRALERSAFP